MIVAVPAALPVTSPAFDTVAISASLDVHVTVSPLGIFFIFEYISLNLMCWQFYSGNTIKN